MKLAQGQILKAVYTLLKDKVLAPELAGAYNLNYVQRVIDDDGSIIVSTCFSDNTSLTGSYIPAYTSQTPTFADKAYIFIYGLNTNETGPQDEFIYEVSISVKCAIVAERTSISAEDLNNFGDTVADLMQPTTFDSITVTGFNIVTQQLEAVNYVLPEVQDSRYEWSVTLDWLVRVEEI